MRQDTNGPQMMVKAERGIFWFLQTSDGKNITAGVARKDHTYALVKSGFTNANTALHWVMASKTLSEFDRGLHDLSSASTPCGAAS